MLRRCFLAKSLSEYTPRNWKGSAATLSLTSPGVHSPSFFTGSNSHFSSSLQEGVTRSFRSLEKAVAAKDKEKESRGFFALPEVDYDVSNGIPPLFSRKQFEMQYFFFHKDAVERLNTHTIGSELEGHNLDVVLRHTAFDASRAVIHTSAAEHFNYCFWYKSLRPWGTSVPSRLSRGLQEWLSGEVGATMASTGSSSRLRTSPNYPKDGSTPGAESLVFKASDSDPVKEIVRRLTIKALNQINRSGWIYLIWTRKKFDVLHFQNGLCPISSDLIPLLCLNINEASFWLDYSSGTNSEEDRFEQYVNNFFKTCNWIVADRNFGAAIDKLS